jgi:hypothetical protein
MMSTPTNRRKGPVSTFMDCEVKEVQGALTYMFLTSYALDSGPCCYRSS